MTHAETVPIRDAGLEAADHTLGEAHTALTLLEYGDYECPACIRVEPLTRRLVETNAHRMRFVFRHFPLLQVHPRAELAAEAAAAQGRFWPMHRLLFSQPQHLGSPALAAYAESIGLDMVRFNAEMADRIYTQRVQEHRRAGERLSLRATPAFFLNGSAIDVSFGFEKLEAAVQSSLHDR